MRRLLLMAAIAATAAILSPTLVHAQLKGMSGGKPSKTFRTDEAVKIDEEVDKEYRAKMDRPAPEVKADPWANVRTPPAQSAGKPK